MSTQPNHPAVPASPPADDPEQVACAVALLLDAAHEIASGRQTLADAQAEFIADAEELFAAVRGPGDFRWPLQRRVAEGVIRWGGFTSEELRFALMGQLDAEALDRGDGWSNIGTAAPPPDSGLAPPVPDAVGARDTFPADAHHGRSVGRSAPAAVASSGRP